MYNEVDDIIGFKYNNEVYYYIKNGQNDIIGILDNNYNKIVEYIYDSWGNILEIKDNSNNNIGIINPFRYRSYYYDNETKLYYLNSRYYNPLWGRFLSIDDYIGSFGTINGLNLFQYGFNNPVNYTDDEGSWPKWIKKLGKLAKKVWNKFVEICNDSLTTLKNAFVFDHGVGVGLGGSAQIGPIKGQISTYKDINTLTINNGNINSNDSASFSSGINLKSPKTSVGLGLDVTEKMHYNYNPFSLPNKMLENPNSSISILKGLGFEKYGSYEWDNESVFIGIALEFHFIIGGHVKIGFNIPKLW